MLKYPVRRLILAVPLILGIVTATFFLSQLAPGDPVDLYLQPQRRNARWIPQSSSGSDRTGAWTGLFTSSM